jgi:L-phenylalanine/L-methionine N-acetyltransferase
VGSLSLETSPTRWRMRHVGSIGMAVRDDWQGQGVGTALMEAALDLADNWLNLTRIELRVYVDNAAATAFQSTKTPPVRFRALIDGVGEGRLELVRA